MTETDTVHIAFGIDAPYLPHLAATIVSLVATAPSARFHFMVLHGGIAEDGRRCIERCAPSAGFDWVEVDDTHLRGLQGHSHISRATFYRLILPAIAAPEITRVLYLDSDVIAARDIRELWRTDLNKRVIAAVYDAGIDAVPFARRWDLAPVPGSYFNAGVLLIDLQRVRIDGVFQTALDFLVAKRAELGFLDQDALNHTLWRQWHRLDPVWNVQRNMILNGMPNYVPDAMRLRGRPAIVHYTTDQKPWLAGVYHPYAWLYWRALARTPFWREVAKANGLSFGARLRIMMRFVKRWPFLAPRSSATAA